MTRVLRARAAWLLLLALGCADDADAPPVAIDLAVGNAHSCLLAPSGAVRCWGAGGVGQLGDGARMDRDRPADVSGLPPDVVAISAQGDSTCVRTEAGEVWCWGHNHRGQLGDGTVEIRDRPVRVEMLPPVVELSVGAAHACARTDGGGVWCWGWNVPGQLGDGTTEDRLRPVVSGAASPAERIEAGFAVSCAIDARDTLECWGLEDSRPPGPVAGVRAVASGADHTCAALTSGDVRCWGSEPGGRGPTLDDPRDYGVARAATIAAAVDHVCLVTEDGEAHCWGKNDHGQLGHSSYVWATEPMGVQLEARAQAIAVGNAHSCTLTGRGDVLCWGANDFGQLGDGTHIESLVPVAPL